MEAAAAQPYLLLEKVSKRYGREPSLITAVEEASLAIGPGEFVVVTGPSGSGKTTLLNLVGGMTRPDRGRILVGGQDLLALSDRQLSRFRGQSLGFAFQFQSLLPTLTALENILLPFALNGMSPDAGRASELLERVGLGGRAGAYPSQMSAGEQRRVAIARALVHRPALLLCDEPTGDLDPDTEALIMTMLREANRQGATVLMTTHNHFLEAYASRRLRMNHGKVSE